MFTCLMQQELQLFCPVTVTVKVHLLETQEEPLSAFPCVMVAGVGKDLPELRVYFTDNCYKN